MRYDGAQWRGSQGHECVYVRTLQTYSIEQMVTRERQPDPANKAAIRQRCTIRVEMIYDSIGDLGGNHHAVRFWLNSWVQLMVVALISERLGG